MLEQAGPKASEADSGAVTLIQRFGSAANLNIHLHRRVLDGAYRRTDEGPVFVATRAPSDQAALAVLHKIIGRLVKILVRRGTLVEEHGSAYLADIDVEGARTLTMSQLELLQRLAALVPSPRLHLIRFHGVLAPNSTLRAKVVPAQPDKDAGTAQRTSNEPGCSRGRPVRIRWARLRRRVFAIDLEHCPNCDGELKIVAAIPHRSMRAPVIDRILSHLGLPARAPPRGN